MAGKSEVIIRGGTIVTVDSAWSVLEGDVACRDGKLVQIGGDFTPAARNYEILDASGCLVMPGLVQSHVHTCQTLARGRADELALEDWLHKVVFPYEAALDHDAMVAAARLACAELLLGGTTAIQDMGSVRHTDALFEVARDAGIRATIGKAMMDHPGPGVPDGLQEATADSIAEAERLCAQWHGQEDGRLRYSFAPRFVPSCTDELLGAVAASARRARARIQTHACETKEEAADVRRRTGKGTISFLADLGIAGDDVTLAHCVWVGDTDQALMARAETCVAHCPSANLKLGSGIAPIPDLVHQGVPVGIGADGAPCNNSLDGFLELRLAALLHRPRYGADALPAPIAVRMATMGGARTLGLQESIGSLEIGKRADVIVVEAESPHVVPSPNPFSALTHSCRAADVRHVVVDGRVLVRDRGLLTLERERALAEARRHARRIFDRLA